MTLQQEQAVLVKEAEPAGEREHEEDPEREDGKCMRTEGKQPKSHVLVVVHGDDFTFAATESKKVRVV